MKEVPTLVRMLIVVLSMLLAGTLGIAVWSIATGNWQAGRDLMQGLLPTELAMLAAVVAYVCTAPPTGGQS